MLTSQARESLRGVETVIVDEVHAVAGTKRGAHLAVSLERLDALLDRPAQRIGLSRDRAPARGGRPVPRRPGAGRGRRAPESEKQWDLKVVVPVEDMTAPEQYDDATTPGRAPTAQPVDLAARRGAGRRPDRGSTARRSSSPTRRRLAERLTARLNEIAADRAGVELADDGTPAGRRSWRSPGSPTARRRSSPRPTTARSPRSSGR